MNYDVIVVGGGPAGLYTALNIRNLEALIIEEHERVGLPKHCTGVVGYWTALQILKLSSKLVTNSYNSIKFITPKRIYEVYSKTPLAYHVSRPELEEALASRVESIGHKLVTGVRAKPTYSLRIKALGRELAYRYLVIADGANSLFRKTLIGDQEVNLYAIQMIVKVKEPADNTLYILYDELNPDFFAWIVPMDKSIVKLGYASRKPCTKYLDLLEKKAGIEVVSVIERFGGIIPLNKPLKNPVFANRIVFHGDAVPLTKPYTGGGLYSIFKLSPSLARHIDTGRLNSYTHFYWRSFYFRSRVEKSLVELLRKTRYYIPVKYVHVLSKVKLINPLDFDNHLHIFLKSLLVSPFTFFL